ncbi:hypothetical protein N5J07_18100, partial [Comamonas aquatica]|uniref:hypothetical protein n=1 Tax=Comamonas aquatica TaxID=225991 RepID=UPI0024472BB4
YVYDAQQLNYYSPDKLNEFSGHGIFYINPAMRIQEFFIGMVLFKLYERIKEWPVFTMNRPGN